MKNITFYFKTNFSKIISFYFENKVSVILNVGKIIWEHFSISSSTFFETTTPWWEVDEINCFCFWAICKFVIILFWMSWSCGSKTWFCWHTFSWWGLYKDISYYLGNQEQGIIEKIFCFFIIQSFKTFICCKITFLQ